MIILQAVMSLSLLAAPQEPEQHKVFVDLPAFKTEECEWNEKWKLFLVHDLLKQRMTALCTPGMTQDEIRRSVQWQVEKIRAEGFSKEEVAKAKAHWSLRLLAIEETSSDITASLDALQSLKDEELLVCCQQFLDAYPIRVLPSEESPQRCAAPLADSAPKNQPTTVSEIDAYYELSLPDHERKLIYDLLRNMAEKSIWGLLFKKREMERLGKRVNHVHPMRFIGFILAEPRLKRYLKEVSTSSFKWDHFIDGFSKRMKEESARDNILLYIPGMAHSLKFDPVRMAAFMRDKDYEGLVKAVLAQR